MSVPTEVRQVRIALVDDDSGLVTVMVRRLEALRWEHEVLSYAPTHDRLAAMRVSALVVNPALSGIDYIERIGTAMPGLAVLAISGPAQVADRVRALRNGADDWITKPVHPEELIARIQAVMRRRRIGEATLDDEPTVAGELTIRPDLFDAYVDDEAAGLSRKEYDLLRRLAAAEGRVLERELIYQRVWGYTMVRGDRSVDVFVRKLRNKLERISPNWRYVHTHFGVGYRFAAEPADPGDAAAAHESPAGRQYA
ncbi:MAG: response regulator transcription factor [Conexibacteraceae bacterium]|nr:response regulator transcription factor [Conexibacteraceae bacterium]